MKLKALLALTAALSFGGALAQDATAPAPVAPAITDVPAGHWAKDAVDELVARRIIIGFPDGTFRGSENLTRYQAAVMIQRLLEQMAAGNATVPADMMTTLQNAVQELASDLAALGVRVADLEDNGVARDDFAALEDRVSGFDDNIGDLTSRVEALEGAAPVDGADLTPIEDRLTALEDSQSAQDDTLTDHEDRIAALEDVVSNLPTQDSLDEVRAGLDDNTAADADLQAAIDELRDGLDGTTTASDTALAQARDLQDALDALTERTDTLEGNFSDLSASVDSNTSSITALNDLTVLLNQDVLSLQDEVAAVLARLDDTDAANAAQFDAVNGQITDLSSSVDQRFGDFQADVDSRFDSVYTELDGLRAFDDVIRRDVDVLTGRVTVNETSIADLNAKVTGIDNRVIALEQYAFTVGGSLAFNYYQSASSGLDRDVDIDRLIPGTKFSTGTDGKDSTKDAATDYSDFGTRRPMVFDNGFSPLNNANADKEGNTSVTLAFNVNFKNRAVSATSGNSGALAADSKGLNVSNIVGEFGLTTDGFEVTKGFGDTTTTPLKFFVKNISSTLSINNNPLTIQFGQQPKTQFSDYVSDNNNTSRGPGFSVTLDGTNVPLIGGLAPKITAIYGSSKGTDNTKGSDLKDENRRFVFVIPPAGSTNVFNALVQTYKDDGGGAGDPVTLYTLPTGATAASIGATPAVNIRARDGTAITDGAGVLIVANFGTVDQDGAVVPSPVGTVLYIKADLADDATKYVYYQGVRAEITPIAGLNLGLNLALEGGDTNAVGNSAFQTIVYGANLKGTNVAGLGINASSEYAQSTRTGVGAKNGSVFYVKADTGNLLGLITVGGNYRTNDGTFDGLSRDGVKGDNNSAPYRLDEVGFGVTASINLGKVVSSIPLTLSGYYDDAKKKSTGLRTNDSALTYGGALSGTLFGKVAPSVYYDAKQDDGVASATDPKSGVRFGAKVAIGSFAGFTLTPFYNQVTIDGVVVNNDSNEYLGDDRATDYGVRLDHNGAADDALIKGLTLTAGYKAQESDYSKVTLDASGTYSTKFAPLNLSVNAGYQSVTDSDAGSDNTVKTTAGAGVSTDPFTGFLGASLNADVAYYNRSHTAGYTANQLNYSVGATFGNFLFPETTAAIKYASYSGTNRVYKAFNPIDNKTEGLVDAKIGGGTGSGATYSLSGIYAEFNVSDVNFAYANLMGNNLGASNNVQAFKVSYKLSF